MFGLAAVSLMPQGSLKTRDWKTRNWKTRHQITGVENEGPENGGTSKLWKAVTVENVQHS